MNCLRVVAAFVLLFFTLSLARSAQLAPRTDSEPSKNASAGRISVHELLIPDKARSAFNKGTKLLTAQKLAASISEFERAIKAFPEFYEAYYKIGLAQMLLHREEDALVAFNTSIVLSKNSYAPPHFGMGVLFASQKKFLEAEAAVRAGLELDPAVASGHLTLAWVLNAAGRLREAENSARHAVLCDAKMALAYLLLAEIHHKLNNLSAVVQDVDAYLQLAPDGPDSAAARTLRAQAQRLLSEEAGGAVVARVIP